MMMGSMVVTATGRELLYTLFSMNDEPSFQGRVDSGQKCDGGRGALRIISKLKMCS